MTRLANLPQSDFRADHYAEVELCERYDLFLAEELNESRNVLRLVYRWLAKHRRMVTFRNQTGPYGIPVGQSVVPVGQIVANAGHIVNAAAANAGRSANTDEANADAGRSVNTDEANKGQIVSANADEANADAGRSANTDEANKGQIVSVNRDNGVPIPTTM
jgi:predicted transcriptional regulator